MIAEDLKKIIDIKAGIKSALQYIGKEPGDVLYEYPDMIERTGGSGNSEDSIFKKYFKDIETVIEEDGGYSLYKAEQCIFDTNREHLILGEYIGPYSTGYELVLNDNWRRSDNIPNPDPDLYDGVYESFSNWHKANSTAIMYIKVKAYPTFKIFVRSFAESFYDYVQVYEPNSEGIVAFSTRGLQNGDQSINGYSEVILERPEDITTETYTIKIEYFKDSSTDTDDDRGYLLIPYNQD